MTLHELLQLPETLLWAWRKVRRCYQMADSLYNQAELAAFDLNLEAELESIRKDFAAGKWNAGALSQIMERFTAKQKTLLTPVPIPIGEGRRIIIFDMED